MLIAAIVFAIALVIGLPIAIVLGLFGTAHLLTLGNISFLNVLPQRIYSQIDLISLTALPFFVLAGELMNAGGVTKRLLDFIREIIGWVKGGLAYATVAISAVLSAILGSPNGVCSMLCGVLVPELRKDGYPEEFSGALVASSSILGPIIPPSVQFILFCMMTNVSVKAMFMGGILPGICLVFVFFAIIAIKTKQMGFKKSIDRMSPRRILKALVSSIPALLVPVVMMGGVISGIFTATEAGAVSCVCAILAGVIYRELDWKKLPQILLNAAVNAGGILLMISLGGVIAWTMSMSGVPQQMINLIHGFTSNSYLIIAIMIIMLMIGGCVMDTGAMMMVFVPVMYPLAMSINMDPVHFGLIFCILVIVGMITPPVGVLLFVTSNIAKIEYKKIVTQIWPFVLGAFIVMVALAYLPDLVLWIPRLAGYGG